jgi:predicted alpha/beta-fold hydrolase
MKSLKNKIIFLAFLTSFTLLAKTVKLVGFPAQGPCIDTLRFVAFKIKDWDFYKSGEKNSVSVLKNQEDTKLTYKLWMQTEKSPLVIIIPGLGGHYAGVALTAISEIIYNRGFSVLVISDPFSWEFLLNASTRLTPGYTPTDSRDVYTALNIILKDVEKKGTNRFSKKILLGYSLGALNTLFIADIDSKEKKINFDRFVALNPPVDLFYGLNKLDEFYNIWRTWSKEEIQQKKNKAIRIYQQPPQQRDKKLPITSKEAKFAIGFVFRGLLMETIKAIHSKKDFGILKNEYGNYSQRHLEKEIERLNYKDYINTFLKASYSDLVRRNFSIEKLGEKASLPAIENTLICNSKIRIIHTADDFLLTDYDREWLKSIMGSRLLFFDHGGHLGYFYHSTAQDCIVRSLGSDPSNDLNKKGAKSQSKSSDFEKLKFN